MKIPTAVLVFILAVPFQSLQAAYQSMPVKTRQVVFENGVRHCEVTRPSYGFRVEILSEDESVKPESLRRGRPFVAARPGERYAVRLYNPLPVRVAANLTIDGLNSITGQPSGITDGSKWIIDPYSFITIRGWQVNGEESRRFFFTPKPKSYAKWSGDLSGKDLAANCGVIGAAYFWSQRELDDYDEAHAQYRYPQSHAFGGMRNRRETPSDMSLAKSLPAAANAPLEEQKEIAGTGMGERESHPTQTVEFQYDRGMYSLAQAIVIYYDFAEAPTPNPFPALSYAPEM